MEDLLFMLFLGSLTGLWLGMMIVSVAPMTTTVHVLLMGSSVMGVFADKDRAIREVDVLVEAFPPERYTKWEHQPGSDLWVCGVRAIRISTHDIQA